MKSNLPKSEERICPKCGSSVEEQPKFKGLFTCIDESCDGFVLTKKGSENFRKELTRQAAKMN